jgi:hypothetical protein
VLSSYEYAYLRVVRVAEGESLNVGVILFCRTRRFLAVKIRLDEQRLAALDPEIDPAAVRAHLALIPRICAGEGPIGRLGQAEAFHWLVHPHSTVIQTSEVHTGLCDDPAAALARLFERSRD